MRYGSVCSGIEAATVAWHPLGWQPQFFSEIEAAPRAVLSHHYPGVPLHGDFTTIREGEYGAIDLLVGGTPCQSFSVAGLRGGLDDERGNLALGYLQLARRLRPRWLVWENVPGVLSSNGGRDFGAILGGMVELGYGFAYRVLDAQYVRTHGFDRAVPQRRRRVFVVGHLGDWRRPAAVLFERASLSGHPAPRREAGKGTAVGALAGTSPGGGWRVGADEAAAGQLVAHALRAQHNLTHREDADTLVAHSLRGEGFDASEDGTGRSTPIVPVAYGGNDTRGPIEVATAVNAHGGPHGRLDFESETFIAFDTTQITSTANYSRPQPGAPCHPLAAGAHAPAIAFSCKDHGADATEEGATPTLRAMGFDRSHANAGGQLAVAFGIRSDASREGSAKTPSADAEGRVRLRDPGLGIYDGLAPTLDAGQPHTVAFDAYNQSVSDVSHPLRVGLGNGSGDEIPQVLQGWAVRRLTPTECERLQGFPDGYTAAPWRGGIMPDGPRYKMLGNSMACNVMRWIGHRIEAVEALSVPHLMAAE